MEELLAMPKNLELFVVMPFGVRRAAREHSVDRLNFDDFYTVIRDIAKSEGWQPTRIDELSEIGNITNQYLRLLYNADLVLADISIPNANVYYEIGVRQAISTGGTLLVAAQYTETSRP